ncbi:MULTISPECIES: hypothetical protein [unclassified Iodidimonas]|jgi:hypothetical protein|uniref:hypothetical protein n=1 Tax=unclassified Iodidimonas TaxID=2626145 RepID=UPI002482E9C3|nr:MULTISPECIES: hypothetical protein [unclassified Iodidimonas]
MDATQKMRDTAKGASMMRLGLFSLLIILAVNGIGFWLGMIYGNQVPLGTAVRQSMDIIVFMVQTPQYVAAWFEQSWGFLWLVAALVELLLPFAVFRLMRHQPAILVGVVAALAASLPDLLPMALDKMTGLLISGMLISALIFALAFSFLKARA